MGKRKEGHKNVREGRAHGDWTSWQEWTKATATDRKIRKIEGAIRWYKTELKDDLVYGTANVSVVAWKPNGVSVR